MDLDIIAKIETIFPLFLIMLLGFLAEKYKILGEGSSKVLNGYVYYFAAPLLLFVAMAEASVRTVINLPFVCAFGGGSGITFLIGFVFSVKILKEGISVSSLRGMAASVPNTIYLGLPILIRILGREAILPATVATVLTVSIFMICVFLLEMEKHREKRVVETLKKGIQALFKNPFFMAPILGIFYAGTGMTLPKWGSSFCNQLGMTAGPCALFAVGQILYGQRVFCQFKELTVMCLLKLIIQPLITLPLLFLFHVNEFWAASGLILSALPTGAVVFVLASQYDVYKYRSSAIILSTTLLSMVTIFGFVVLVALFWPVLLQ